MENMENDDLSLYLSALARDNSYWVAETLKRTPHESTEVVYFTGAHGGELGPFVRKRIDSVSGLGDAYRRLCEAQRSGQRFRYLPHIYDVHERDEKLIVIMEYVAGRTLQDEVYENDSAGSLAATLFPKLCDGVAELHEGMDPPLIHRDLKPSNIMVQNDNLTIIDFGIARTYRNDADSDTTPFGTRTYAPPEQLGFCQTDEQSDIYALGMILFFLITEQICQRASLEQGFPELAALPAMQAVVTKATAFDPAARYQSVSELKHAFLQAVEAAPIATERMSIPSAPIAPVVPGVSGAQSQDVAIQSSSLQREDLSSATPSLQREDPSSATPSEVLGIVWDTIVVLLWLLFMCALFIVVINPSEPVLQYPTWMRFLIYPLAFGLFFTGAAYGLMDKRWLRRHIPLLKGQTYGKSLIVALVIMGCGIVLLGSLLVVLAAMTAFT